MLLRRHYAAYLLTYVTYLRRHPPTRHVTCRHLLTHPTAHSLTPPTLHVTGRHVAAPPPPPPPTTPRRRRRHTEVEARGDEAEEAPGRRAFVWAIVQIIVIDMVFSLDSIITAIGMSQDLAIMIAAVVIACLIMYASSGPVARFVAEHPTTKMLALAFLLLIGVALVATDSSSISRAATSISPSRFRPRSSSSTCWPDATARKPVN